MSLSLEHPYRTKRAHRRPWTTLNTPPHPRHPLPVLLATRLSPSFPCESIVRSRGAPWLSSSTVRGWLLAGSRGLVEAVATTPEQQRRTPILRTTTGFGDRRISTPRVRSFLSRTFLYYSLICPNIHYILYDICSRDICLATFYLIVG